MIKQRLRRQALEQYDPERVKYQNRYKAAFLSIMRMRARLSELDDAIHEAAQITDNALANLPENSNVSECKEIFAAADKCRDIFKTVRTEMKSMEICVSDCCK